MDIKFVLEYAIASVQVIQDVLKLKGTHHLLVYVDDIHILALQGNAKSLLVAGREIGLEVNAYKSKYMFMSRVQNAGRCQSVNFDNSSFERVEDFKYLEIILKYKKCIQEEIKSRMKPGNACYHLVRNFCLLED